ncbi:ZYRO0C02992p [Zygosaccharomyces rouxii]|uniref:ZYRO0C02992p n=1 Tax=Zygosaccharomyces rouxii (strain ATCC 2623 / CBS 732 / NBRC 1130 / NCYC 568 / NRRL Y-229) TaxID=559307 RepID=C5DSU1_ZYGRC|nr:uncharacterized protein ZYRO0C02992g [Zygosaccharomyces rouxii]KAH9201958.1 hypothetical protein LQ764DRAFT_91595 [Zygosaccharomyces rouxii]CAR26852.1 ZYRO0C02992p [Zygosaccharomyces rouxii]
MPEVVPFEDDDLLLELMDRYKPHLKPYAYRLQTWSQVLEEYNALTDNHYRQTRTLKKKFERLKELYEYDATKIKISDMKRLERLVSEADQIGKRTHTDRPLKVRQQQPQQQPQQQQQQQQQPQISTEPNFPSTNVQDDAGNSSDNSQPPPLDSIIVGFPHNVSSPHRSITASASANASLFDNSPHDPIPPPPPPPAPSASPQRSQHQPQRHSDDLHHRNMEILDKLFDPAITSPREPISNPSGNASSDNRILENIYLEFREYKKSQEEFQKKLLHKLDLLTEAINKG